MFELTECPVPLPKIYLMLERGLNLKIHLDTHSAIPWIL